MPGLGAAAVSRWLDRDGRPGALAQQAVDLRADSASHGLMAEDCRVAALQAALQPRPGHPSPRPNLRRRLTPRRSASWPTCITALSIRRPCSCATRLRTGRRSTRPRCCSLYGPAAVGVCPAVARPTNVAEGLLGVLEFHETDYCLGSAARVWLIRLRSYRASDVDQDRETVSGGFGEWAHPSGYLPMAAGVKACVTPALARRRSHALAASGQMLHKPRGRKPRRTPRWSLSAAAMAIGLRWRRNRGACDAPSRPRRRARKACGAALRGGIGQRRGIQRPRSSSARSNPPVAEFGVELIGGDGARS
jgi:hypothetical protein